MYSSSLIGSPYCLGFSLNTKEACFTFDRPALDPYIARQRYSALAPTAQADRLWKPAAAHNAAVYTLREEDLGAFKHRTYQELQALSESQQCDLCSMIWQTLAALGSTEKILAEEPDKVSVILEYHAAWDSIFVSPDLPTSTGSTIELFTMRGARNQRSMTKKGTAPSHKSPETYQFIRETVQDCVSHHRQCSKNVDVELLTFQDKLAKNTLPEALQDAVHVTRELGHRHIWIDALCVIQDDEGFKQLELPKMNRIYQNAFLTIQPTNSASVENRFLEGRKTTPM